MKHIAKIATEFLKIITAESTPWWTGKSFNNPETNNRVRFKSLPIEEQKRLNALHREKVQAVQDKKKQKVQKRKDRELIKKKRVEEKLKAKKDKAEQKAKEIASITPETHPNYFTKDGKRLSTTRGFDPKKEVLYNPDWNSKKDDTYYAKQFQRKDKKGRDVYLHFYTDDYIKKFKKEKFARNKKFGEMLPDIRQKYAQDLKSPEERTRVYSTAVALVDQCACRIGNKGSEEDDVRGLHNLQVKHIKMNGNDVNLSYVGKDKQQQNHQFKVDDSIKKNLNELIKDKKPEDPIFTWNKQGENIRIAPKYVNRYLKRQLKAPVTVHKFRTYHATRIAKEEFDSMTPLKFSEREMERSVKNAMTVVSDFLGNTPNVARKHYVDPTVIQDFYKKAGMKMPTKFASTKKIAFEATSNPNLSDKELKFNDWMDTLNLDEYKQ